MFNTYSFSEPSFATMTESAIGDYLPTTGTGVVELYVRETAPTCGHTKQRDCFERLARLEDSGHLDSVTVRIWGDSICTRAPEVNGLSDILETITDIYSFSSGQSVSVAPFFQVETVDASIPNETFERIVPPHRTLVLSDDDGIVGVFPCLQGEEAYSAFEAIEELERTAELNPHEGREISAKPRR